MIDNVTTLVFATHYSSRFNVGVQGRQVKKFVEYSRKVGEAWGKFDGKERWQREEKRRGKEIEELLRYMLLMLYTECMLVRYIESGSRIPRRVVS